MQKIFQADKQFVKSAPMLNPIRCSECLPASSLLSSPYPILRTTPHSPPHSTSFISSFRSSSRDLASRRVGDSVDIPILRWPRGAVPPLVTTAGALTSAACAPFGESLQSRAVPTARKPQNFRKPLKRVGTAVKP